MRRVLRVCVCALGEAMGEARARRGETTGVVSRIIMVVSATASIPARHRFFCLLPPLLRSQGGKGRGSKEGRVRACMRACATVPLLPPPSSPAPLYSLGHVEEIT